MTKKMHAKDRKRRKDKKEIPDDLTTKERVRIVDALKEHSASKSLRRW